MKNIVVLFLLIMTSISCDSQLTTEQATQIISKRYPTFCTSKLTFTKAVVYFDGTTTEHSRKTLKILRKLELDGVIVLNEAEAPYSPGIEYQLVLTDEYKKKYRNKLALTSNEFVEIIGISQNKNEAIVKYKMKSVKTPLYALHYKNYNKYRCYEAEWEVEKKLVKFDNGWKIVKK